MKRRGAFSAFLACSALATIATAVVAAATKPAGSPPAGMQQAIFAGGCFWSMEHVFDEIPGVQSVTVGYTGGSAKAPSYEQVEMGITGHAESVLVVFDPSRVGYDSLLDAYWHNTDPSDGAGQFCDTGAQYRPVIFYSDDAQRQRAEASKRALEASHRFTRVLTRIEPASTFWIAEDYHQRYYKTHAAAYTMYRIGCRRDATLHALWGR